MAELSGFWTTTDTATGDQQASYTQAQWSSACRILAGSSGFEGVITNYLNEYACSDGGANTVDVATGGAMVDGKWVYNDAVQNINIDNADAGETRIDRIVLRADWANFNVSVHAIVGTSSATPSAPAVTQTSGTTYDIKLCQALVTDAGAITVTDEREWAIPTVDGSTLTSSVGILQIKDDGVDSDQIAAGAIDSVHLAKNAAGNKVVYWRVIPINTTLTTGDGLDYFTVPSDLNGYILSDFDIAVYTVSSSGTPTVQLYNLTDTTDMLTTVATIDESEYSSYTAATAPVIDTDNDDVATGDRLRVDVDVAGTDTAGLDVIMVFQEE